MCERDKGEGRSEGWRGAYDDAICRFSRTVPPPEQPQRNIPGEMGAVFSKLFAALIGNREVRGSCCTLLAAYEALSQALSRAITLRRFVCSSLA